MNIKNPHPGIILIQGDSVRLLDRLKYDSVVTDVTYGYDYKSSQAHHNRLANDSTTELLYWVSRVLAPHSKYICAPWNALLKGILPPRSVIPWIKNGTSQGDLAHEHARCYENILFYPGPAHFFPTGVRATSS